VPFEASELAARGEPVALVQGIRRPAGGAADYALSANGTLVYVPGTAQELSRRAVVWVDRTGQVVARAIPDLVANPRDPRLSPDGQRLLLVTGGDAPVAGDLWSYDLRGRPPLLLALPSDTGFPVWSPDGRQVAFMSLGSGQIMTLAADGSERVPQPLRTAFGGGPQVWSTTGEIILQRPPGDIIAIPASPTADARNIVVSDSTEYDPALSADGRWLAYLSNRTGRGEIWVQAYPDGVPVRVSDTGGYEPLWSADGRELFYRQGDAVMAVAVEPAGAEFSFATPQRLFSGPFVQTPLPTSRAYAVARDGRFLMIQSGEQDVAAPASIVVVQNFGEEIKQRVRPSGR
jgi:dipeptidyl aminopeptidase/acylaminoacyl peptidase